MVSLWMSEEQQHQEYFRAAIHGNVLSLPEILEVVIVHGIPNGELKRVTPSWTLS